MRVTALHNPISAPGLHVAAVVSVLVVGCLSACGSPSTQAPATSPTVAISPTPDALTQNYIALVHNYWIAWQAADGVANGINQAAVVCLGTGTATTPVSLQRVDTAKCRARVVVLLAMHQKFLKDLDSTPPPPKFAGDDMTFRSLLPKLIADAKAIIAAADTRSKEAVLQASGAYATDAHAGILNAMDDVDPAVVHQ